MLCNTTKFDFLTILENFKATILIKTSLNYTWETFIEVAIWLICALGIGAKQLIKKINEIQKNDEPQNRINFLSGVKSSCKCWLVNGSYQLIWEVYVAALITVHIRHACKAAEEYHRHFSYLRIICLRFPLRIRAHQSIPFIRYAFCNSEAVDR